MSVHLFQTTELLPYGEELLKFPSSALILRVFLWLRLLPSRKIMAGFPGSCTTPPGGHGSCPCHASVITCASEPTPGRYGQLGGHRGTPVDDQPVILNAAVLG